MVAILFLVALVLALLFVLRTRWVHIHLEQQIKKSMDNIGETLLHKKVSTQVEVDNIIQSFKKEHYTLAWSGKNPIRVIALNNYINRNLSIYSWSKALASDYYGQGNKLVKKGNLPTAIAFYLKAKKHAEIAMSSQDEGHVHPFDFEVLSAPYFLLAKIPVVGRIWYKDAINPLLQALELIDENEQKKKDNWRLANAIISSKLHALTGDERYLHRVAYAGITRDDEMNQLARVAKHLRLPTVESLFRFCEI